MESNELLLEEEIDRLRKENDRFSKENDHLRVHAQKAGCVYGY
jgi:hypothetical protein